MKRGTNGSKVEVMPLSDLQLTTATIVLAVPEAHGFALAGGAALVIHEVVDRGTKDLDCFGPSTDAVNALVDPVIEALTAHGFTVDIVIRNDGFAKLLVNDGADRTQVDLGFDPASLDPVPSIVGPLRHLRDLAGDKVLALFARAASRDFVDVAALLRQFAKDELCQLAHAKDGGFNLENLADAFGVLRRYDRNDEYPSLTDDEYESLLRTFDTWQQELRSR
jgi:hypothetical protein